MANTKDITSVGSNILLIGDAGTHKTWFAGSIPGNYIFDFDKGLATLRGQNVEYDTFKDLPRFSPTGAALVASDWHKAKGLYSWGQGWDAFYKQFMAVCDRIERGDTSIQCMTFDSLTMLSMLAINKILRDTNQPSPHQGTWGAHHEYFKTIFSMATALPIRLVATAHIKRDENDVTKNVEKLPLLAGQMAGLIGIFFDEVWYCDTKRLAGGAAEYTITTATDGTFRQAKSRWDVPNGTKVNNGWLDVKHIFEGAPPPERPPLVTTKPQPASIFAKP